MKILIVNAFDIAGGAARAAYRLHNALLAQDIDSQMLVQSKASDDDAVLAPETKIQRALVNICPALDSLPTRPYKGRTKTWFSPAWTPFSNAVDRINALNPDIVHLNWIANGMMRIEDIAKIKAPIVWSLHDMWAFTGGCHYDEECGGFKNNCGHCKVLGSNKTRDLSSYVYARKKMTFAKIKNLTIIGLSRWMSDCARQSSLLRNTSVYQLPNPINTSVFAPIDKEATRSLLNLPQNKKLVLFGAIGAMSDPRKGFTELSAALEKINSENIELVVFGSSQPKTPPNFKQKTHYLGHLHDDVSLRVLYSAVDVMVVPSLQENLSNAIMESLSCGTPVVGFDIGGNSDLIEHQKTGYLAKPFQVEDLALGIEWVLNTSDYSGICINAREKVLREFDSNLVAKKYINLYKKILTESN